MKLADKITKDFMSYIDSGSYDMILPNFYLGWEMDMCKITNSGYIIEYEIKITKSDFLKDFEKGRKHELLESGKLDCNRFYFVVPTGLVDKSEIPNYAGLIYYELMGDRKNPVFKTIKNAKILHKNKKIHDQKFSKYLIDKLVFRDKINKSKISNLKWQKKELEKTLKIIREK